MINEVVKATTDTMMAHEGVGRVSGHLKSALRGEVVSYLGRLKEDVERVHDTILELYDGNAPVFAKSRGWCGIAKEHAEAATGSVSTLLGADSPNAQNLIDVTADGVRMTTEWSEGTAGNPENSIPDSVIEHLEEAIQGLAEAIEAINAKAEAVYEQGQMLAERSSKAGNGFLSET